MRNAGDDGVRHAERWESAFGNAGDDGVRHAERRESVLGNAGDSGVRHAECGKQLKKVAKDRL